VPRTLRQNNNSDDIQQLLDAYHDGYLNEQILERIIHKIARKHARREANRNNIWTFGAVFATLLIQLLAGNLLPTLQVALSGMSQVSQPSQATSLEAFQPNSQNSEITTTFAPLNIETPFLIDNSPPGAWDFTLKRDRSVEVEIPSPCTGVVRRVYFQGKTGNLETGRGAGQIVEINCTEDTLNGRAYGWMLGHLQRHPPVQAGQKIRRGQTLGVQGITGRTSGHHVHAQLHYQNNWQRIEDRSATRSLVQDYLSFVQTGIIPSDRE